MGESSLHDLSANQRKQNSQSHSPLPWVWRPEQTPLDNWLQGCSCLDVRGRRLRTKPPSYPGQNRSHVSPRACTATSHAPAANVAVRVMTSPVEGARSRFWRRYRNQRSLSRARTGQARALWGVVVRPVRAHCGIEWTPYGRAPTGSDIMSPPWLAQVPPESPMTMRSGCGDGSRLIMANSSRAFHGSGGWCGGIR